MSEERKENKGGGQISLLGTASTIIASLAHMTAPEAMMNTIEA